MEEECAKINFETASHIKLYKTVKIRYAYKKVVTRVIVRTPSKVPGESCYFHPFLKRVVIAKLMVPATTYVCENTKTGEIRLERAFVVDVQNPNWTEEEMKEFKNMETKGYTANIRSTSFISLCTYYDVDSEVRPFKPFTMEPFIGYSGFANGIYAYWDEKSAQNFKDFEN